MLDVKAIYERFGEEIVEYMEKHGRTPGSMLRIFQRLHMRLPANPGDGHSLLVNYMEQHGANLFKAKMGLLREHTPDVVYPHEKKAPKPEPRTPAPPGYAVRSGKPGEPESANRRTLASEPKSAPKPSGAQPIPAALAEFPREALTPEAIEAAKAGRSPFGEEPLLDRRSGVDRRSGTDRRQNLELVFRNSRYGGSRRKRPERRKNAPPPRPNDMAAEDAIGSAKLKSFGWKPKLSEPEES